MASLQDAQVECPVCAAVLAIPVSVTVARRGNSDGVTFFDVLADKSEVERHAQVCPGETPDSHPTP